MDIKEYYKKFQVWMIFMLTFKMLITKYLINNNLLVIINKF